MKGMTLETMGFVLIALFGVFVLIVFITGSLGELGRNVICYFYQNVLSQDLDMCETRITASVKKTIRPEDSEDLAREIAAHSIICWEESVKSLKTKDTYCYNLMIEGGPFSPGADEIDVTDILLEEGGCNRLENYYIDSNCGNEDQLRWEVGGPGFFPWENRGIDAGWLDPCGTVNITNGRWMWSWDGNSWSDPVDLSTIEPWKSIPISGVGYRPWENGGIDAGWLSSDGIIGITNGKWAWNWDGSNWNGPFDLYESEYWGDEYHAEHGMEPCPEGHYPWEGKGIDSGWTDPNGITNITNGRWMWSWDGDTWSDPIDMSETPPWDSIPISGVGYLPWENGGIDAGWLSSDGKVGVTNGKWAWNWDGSSWSDVVDLETVWSTVKKSDNCLYSSECSITDQKLVLIKYDDVNKQIVVKAGEGQVTTSTVGPGVTTTTVSGTTTTTGLGSGCIFGSPCTSGWPGHEGGIREFNEDVYACDVFEVCDPDLQFIADEAIDCCENGCSSSCHGYCSQARKDSGICNDMGVCEPNPSSMKVKKCSAFYLALGLGQAADIMNGYYQEEIDCANPDITVTDCGFPGLQCKGCLDVSYNPPSSDDPEILCGWSSDPNADTDMSKNSCYMSDVPAHVSIDILNKGICMDYSIALTTLLRMVGYEVNEVYTEIGADGPADCLDNPDCNTRPECCRGHAWNIVQLPGENRWLIMDTTGNDKSYVISSFPKWGYDYCSALGVFNGESLDEDGCSNDAQKVNCPGRSNTIGCEV